MKIQSSILPVIFLFCSVIAGFSLHAARAGQEGIVTQNAPQSQSIKSRQQEAFVIFKEILKLSDSPERQKNLARIKELYRKIITQYPDLGLAQESYMRLIILARSENTPEGNAEAENIYQEFRRKYPDSRLQRVIENELNKH